MAVALEFLSLIIPIEKIEEYYPGGFEEYTRDHLQLIGGRIWFDNYLVRDGAMNPHDIKLLVTKWESFGLITTIEKNGKKQWKDLCVVDYFGGPTLPCEWLISEENIVHHFLDKSTMIINRDNCIDFQLNLFNPVDWLKKFRSPSKNKLGYRELRADIYQQTVKIVQRGKYYLDGNRIELDNSKITKETFFYDRPKHLNITKSVSETKFAVIEADCIETAELLKKAGYQVCLLNMANRQNPGGGVLRGAGAQEENLFRRSNILLSLYQFVDYSIQYGIERNQKSSYPLDRNSGGIYSKDVTIFRSSEKNGYCFLKNPFKISVVSVPAINRPELDFIDGEYFIAKKLIEPSKEKIRTILRISGAFDHNCLVLSAFGCGAFCNPPKHMAQLFKEVFCEPEFKNKFELVVFAILDDHNSWKDHNPEGNTMPFFKAFENAFS